MGNESIVTKKGEGTAFWVIGTLMELKVTGDQTNGKFTVAEQTTPPGALGAPPHKHTGNEALYVLEGTIRYRLGDRTVDLGPGSLIHIASGTWEYYENVGKTPARVLAFWTDPNIHKFFAEAFEPARTRELPAAAPPTPEQFGKIVAVAQRYGLEIKPPPQQ